MTGFFQKCFYLIFLLLLTATILLAQNEEGVYATSLEPLTNAAYKIVFNAETEIPANAEIDIVFPPQANLSRVLHAGSDVISGSFATTVVQDTVKLQRRGNGDTISPQLVDLIVAMIINPSETNRDYLFKALIRTEEEMDNQRSSY